MATFRFDPYQGITHLRGTLRRNSDGTRLEARTDSHGRTRIYLMSRYQRSTPVTAAEIAGRTRFGCITRAVADKRRAGDTRPRKLIWNETAAEYDAANQAQPSDMVGG